MTNRRLFKSLIIGTLCLGLPTYALAGTTTYKYDTLGRVVLSSSTNYTVQAYSYDRAGNRTYTARLNVAPPTNASLMMSNEGLVIGTSINSSNGQYGPVLQHDGNLVVYGPSGANWSSGTFGKTVVDVVMQGDGNLVLYGIAGEAFWNSGTSGHPGAYLAMQNDGNLVIYSPGGVPLWHSL